nr:hypothetical protein [Piscinibacter sp.]
MSAHTTLNAIRAHSPCEGGWRKLLAHLGKTKADDEPLPLTTILDSNGLDDALWCLRTMPQHDKHWRLFAVWCARRVQHLMKDQRSIAALDVAERHAHGMASDSELDAAWAAARDAAWAAARDAAMDAARAAARAAARDAAMDAAWAAARDAARDAAMDAARDAAWAAARDAARYAAWAAARDAARYAAWDAAASEPRRVCASIN